MLIWEYPDIYSQTFICLENPYPYPVIHSHRLGYLDVCWQIRTWIHGYSFIQIFIHKYLNILVFVTKYVDIQILVHKYNITFFTWMTSSCSLVAENVNCSNTSDFSIWLLFRRVTKQSTLIEPKHCSRQKTRKQNSQTEENFNTWSNTGSHTGRKINKMTSRMTTDWQGRKEGRDDTCYQGNWLTHKRGDKKEVKPKWRVLSHLLVR